MEPIVCNVYSYLHISNCMKELPFSGVSAAPSAVDSAPVAQAPRVSTTSCLHPGECRPREVTGPRGRVSCSSWRLQEAEPGLAAERGFPGPLRGQSSAARCCPGRLSPRESLFSSLWEDWRPPGSCHWRGGLSGCSAGPPREENWCSCHRA